MSANRPTVLILTSDPAFSREITERWPQHPAPHSDAPEFIVLDGGFSRDLKGSNYDLAIADASCYQENSLQDEKVRSVEHDESIDIDKDNNLKIVALKQSLAAPGKPTIIIYSSPAADFYDNGPYNLHGAVIELRREPAIVGLIGREILRCRQAELRAAEAEQDCASAQAEATLGRYMLEMRTNVNNALTTLLGNAELLALESGLPATVQAQADTIRNMALRLHEVFQRFSSIEKELTVAAREAGKKAVHASGRN